ncbi:MAG: hypothetical protein FWF15_09445 [Oscillospiraceae bacterium]|nr:hypothetical protein [Oscillospiraceae bacterium]
MIIDALKTMVFGMLGIFFVMGVIAIYIQVLKFISKKQKVEADDNDDSDDD